MTNELGDLVALARRSVDLITSFQDVGGAYPASPTFPVYQFSWFRDGAFIADAMSRVGAQRSADAFFDWCTRVLRARRDQVLDLIARKGTNIERDEFLPTRYTLGGSDTAEQWWNFQIDGYGTWMWALIQHSKRHAISLEPYREALELSAQYLCAFWSLPCFDWWEEHPGEVHPSTIAAVSAGLRAAASSGVLGAPLESQCNTVCAEIELVLRTDAVVDGHLTKSVGRTDTDASLISCFTPFETLDSASDLSMSTYARIAHELAPDGVHRYLADTFFGGGRWVVLAGFVGWHEVRIGNIEAASRRLRWMHDQATGEGFLPEQVLTHALHPDRVAEWVQRWGPVATPLLWSHAMYLTLGCELGLWGSELSTDATARSSS